MSPRRVVEHELSKDKILNVARILFSSQGIQQVSMRDIAKELGYSHGSIYYHFKNKTDLFSEILTKDFDLLNQTLDRVVCNEHSLKEILLGFIEFGLTYPYHYEIMFMNKDNSFLNHPASDESYKRFVQEVSKFHISLSQIYSLFLSIHGFISFNLRIPLSYDELKSSALEHVDFLLKNIH
ncbi:MULTISPECIES: TetR/AcrR family transcriptional regulator [Metabacillus]|jgi:AcrR family transcriptional regulator|uniref:TetR/AcrR family transcriptional regulator n=1 Tax=Metabacillus rhizolycopersici TaxID=2875709 RepID=A0ABS7UQM5_9BACI|nr:MULTISPECIES: TetR/AcrR family transcriptional regulator [Metabacillus]MBZ5750608.1 TetR/AcrR family transcriptional regulator [Metabacillus rhizolycopersici]MCM3651747.1 TetR/AcrR family transcriptional regulator [Metabacillus litoralis]